MTDQSTFQLSQGLDVLSPRSGKAYPIPCDEWNILKDKIGRLTSEPWLFHGIGFLLLGAALSALVSIFLGAFDIPNDQRRLDLAWSVFAVTAISGMACLFFAHKERGTHRERATDIVAQMDLIEKRFE